MLFFDRLFLARYNAMALNAAVSAGMAYYMFLVIPMGIMEISEVLVGRLHGEERHDQIGSATWQMVIMSVVFAPLFFLLAWFAPPLLFSGTGNEVNETNYFCILMAFAPIQCICIAISGFFIGIGKVRIVTCSAIIGNLVNIVLDALLIFGWGPVPALGIIGAGLATGVSIVAQGVYLVSCYWNKEYRIHYNTQSLGINRLYLSEGFRLGIPSGAGRCLECVAHFLFLRAVMVVGPEQMAIVATAQSIYLLASFVTDAQCKGASAIVSNLLGARLFAPIGQVLKSAFTLHFGYFIILSSVVWLFPEFIFDLFLEKGEGVFVVTPELLDTFKRTLMMMSLFFLFDGCCWVLIGFLTAAKDTRYVFWVSVFANCVAYVPPTLFLVAWYKGGADIAWGIVVGVTTMMFVFYMRRYLSGQWLKYSDLNEPLVA